MNDQKPPPCVYTLLDNGIHEFIFYEASRAAVDIFISIFAEIYEGVTPDQPQQILFDVRDNDLQLMYLFSVYQKWLSTHHTRIPTRLAVLLDTHPLIAPLVKLLIQRLSVSQVLQVRFFVHAEDTEAFGWLDQKR